MIARVFMSLVVLFSIILWAGYFYLGSAAQAGIEFAGESALMTEVSVDSLSLSPLNGKTSIRGLSIANPAGFSEGPAILLGAVEAEVDISSIFGDTVEIELLRLAQPQINYETKMPSDNLRALLANLPSGDDGAASESAPASTKKNFSQASRNTRATVGDCNGLGHDSSHFARHYPDRYRWYGGWGIGCRGS